MALDIADDSVVTSFGALGEDDAKILVMTSEDVEELIVTDEEADKDNEKVADFARSELMPVAKVH